LVRTATKLRGRAAVPAGPGRRGAQQAPTTALNCGAARRAARFAPRSCRVGCAGYGSAQNPKVAGSKLGPGGHAHHVADGADPDRAHALTATGSKGPLGADAVDPCPGAQAMQSSRLSSSSARANVCQGSRSPPGRWLASTISWVPSMWSLSRRSRAAIQRSNPRWSTDTPASLPQPRSYLANSRLAP
jgi:hypothetical protein